MQDWGITVLRVVVGTVFLMHGGQKLIVYGIGGVVGAFAQYGIPVPALSAVLTTLAVHAKSGFFLPGAEYTVILLAAVTALLLAGSGRASVGGLLAGRGRPRGEA